MQSADYVPGISGWKIHDNVRLVINDGNRRIHAEVKMITTAGPGQTNDEAAQAIRDLVREAKGQHASRVTAIRGTITNEASARVNADNALATPFVVVDGQVFICQAAIDSLLYVKDPARFKVKLSVNEQGQYVAAGIGIGVQDAEQPKRPSVNDLLDQIKAQISEAQLATDLESRIALLEQGQAKQGGENRAVNDRLTVVELNRVSQKGLDEAAAVLTAQRIDALQAQIEILQGKSESRG
ncbi:hypothetical protein [Pseudomonas juntendi]|uniref:hypothetical protein n=1 Tax=Pseudomonas juntendi TaxID=2666183 RepID=UPI00244918C5|nr:hypothetical protein [Pseudomonas juntendi]MDG9890579.1 hypothetical protein [Pseudomonas juntendi]